MSLSHRPLSRRAAVSVAGAAACVGILWPAVAQADGPGYGGSADRLSVSWAAGSGGSAALPGGGGGSGADLLVVTGLGFRGLSAVSLQVGNRGAAVHRSSDVGSVRIEVPSSEVPTAPGTSVIAIGRAPSGTTRTLVGAVPPRSHGPSPTDVVVVLGGALGLTMVVARQGGRVVRRRRAQAGSNL